MAQKPSTRHSTSLKTQISQARQASTDVPSTECPMRQNDACQTEFDLASTWLHATTHPSKSSDPYMYRRTQTRLQRHSDRSNFQSSQRLQEPRSNHVNNHGNIPETRSAAKPSEFTGETPSATAIQSLGSSSRKRTSRCTREKRRTASTGRSDRTINWCPSSEPAEKDRNHRRRSNPRPEKKQ